MGAGMRAKDCVVVVTGASSGIGRATALAFAAKGASVVLAARRAQALDDVAGMCVARGGKALAVPTDVTDPTAVLRLAERAVGRFGRFDVWVNDAAVSAFSPFEEIPLDVFRRVLDVNVMGYVHGARAALAQFRRQDYGVLVNVSSVVSGQPQPYTHPYAMSKAAVRALGSSLRQELALDGAKRIKVCTVMPATIDTPLFEHTANYTGRKTKPMPPVYPAERVAHAVVDLVRAPRNEVVVGSAGRLLFAQSAVTARLAQRWTAWQVDRGRASSRAEPAEATSGNVFEPSADSGAVSGGWHGRRQTALRRAAAATSATTLAVGAAVAVRRRTS